MHRLMLAVAVVATASTACGPETNNRPDLMITPPSRTDMDEKDETPDPDMTADTDMDEMDVVDPPGEGICANQIMWGELNTSAAGTQTFTVSNEVTPGETPINGVSTACGFGGASERAMSFTVSGPARIRATLTPKSAANWALELRRGDCDGDEAVSCSTDRLLTFVAEESQPYFLVLEPIDAAITGEVDIALDVTPLSCSPIGSTTCAGSTLSRCEGGGTNEVEYACGEPCASDACGADTCAGAVEVTSYPYMFTGDAAAYASDINYDQENTCLNPDAGDLGMMGGGMVPLPTPGQDVTFRLPNLAAGQMITVDASSAVGNMADSAIFITRDCTDVMSCLYVKDMGDKIEGWMVPEAGDYFVTVDRTLGNLSEIRVSIDVQ